MNAPRPRPIALAAIGLLAALLLQACGGAPAATSAAPAGAAAPADTPVGPSPTPLPPKIGKVGEAITADGATLTVASAIQADQMADGQKPGDGNTFLIADVQIANSDANNVAYNEYVFQIKDADGKTYNSVVTLNSQALRQGNLSKGQQAKGLLSFKIPKTAKGLVLLYSRSGYAPMQVNLQ